MRLALPLILALSASAQAPPALVVHTRSGEAIQIERRATGPRSFIVEFREAPRGLRTTVDRFRRDLGGRQPRTQSQPPAITHEFFRAFHGVAVVVDDAEAAAIRRFAYVKAVHEDAKVEAFATTGEDRTRLARIGAERVWAELGTRGKGVDVAVIDTGVDYTHPALASRYAGGFDFVKDDEDPMDEHGHGTHVAGIILGTTAEVPGMAPEARLFAYRVLNQHGSGLSSDVVAGIERAMDPNLDGDPSDRLDVINLSLGSSGDADSPTSVAVDRAVAAGIVVCSAAGNRPGGQTIGSPAAARLGIAVGSADPDDVLALYSSRGPAFPDFHVKPDLVAPGNSIRSAKRGGGTIVMSGTSMAAPHVAGAAALLLSLNPSWTPGDVKAALAATAKPLEVDVMSQGAGRIDVYAAARALAAISPAVLSLGRNANPADWTAAQTVRIMNRSPRAQTFTAAAAGPITVEPASFTLDAGAWRDVTVTASIPASAEQSLITLSHGGRVSFTSADGTTVLPWASVEGAMVTVRSEDFSTEVVWSCDAGLALRGRMSFGRSDALLPHGRCELVASAENGIGDMAVVMQPHVIEGDRELTVDKSLAPHSIRVAGVDAQGRPIGRETAAGPPAYQAQYLLELPEPSPFRGLQIVTVANAPLRVSDMPDGTMLTAGEVLYDLEAHRIIGIQHPRRLATPGDITLANLPGDLHHARLEISPRPGTLHGWTSVLIHGAGGSFYSAGWGVPLANGWSGDVYVTKDASPVSLFAAGVHTEDYPEVQLDIASPSFRAIDGRIVFSNDRVPAPNAYSVAEGGTLRLGEMPVSPRTFLHLAGTSFRLSLIGAGPAGEWRYGLPALEYELRGPGGDLLAGGRADYVVTADPGSLGPYRLDVRTQRMSQLSLTFDTSRDDFNPPTITSFRVDGRTLLFSTGDYKLTETGSRCQELRSTRASIRASGGAWRALPITEVVNDRGENLGRFETGTLYRASLDGWAGAVDVRVEMEDLAGNTSTVTMENVLGMPLRRRSVR